MPDDFHHDVSRFFGGRCSNCGSDDRCRPKLVVPVESGGHRVVTNAAFLCRACNFLLGGQPKIRNIDKQCINLWVSEDLHNWTQRHPRFDSGSALVRHVIDLYMEGGAERFDDLALYQDRDPALRLFVWTERSAYDLFQRKVRESGQTVTSILISLLLLFQSFEVDQ